MTPTKEDIMKHNEKIIDKEARTDEAQHTLQKLLPIQRDLNNLITEPTEYMKYLNTKG